MYSYSEVVEGVLYTVCFFSSFSGHFQPWTPVDPLRFEDLHDGQTYYRAWYRESEHGPKLDRLQKFYFLLQNIDAIEAVPKKEGDYYFSIMKKQNEWEVGELITPEQVLKRRHYAIYIVDQQGKLERAQHVFATQIWEYEYSYQPNGALKDSKHWVKPVPIEMSE